VNQADSYYFRVEGESVYFGFDDEPSGTLTDEGLSLSMSLGGCPITQDLTADGHFHYTLTCNGVSREWVGEFTRME
jgi:hypothetical protein